MGIYLGGTELSSGGGGGGGGFTKQNKYSTFRSKDDATHKTWVDVFYGLDYNNTPAGSTTISSVQGTYPTHLTSFNPATNQAVGGTFVHNGTTHTITSNSSGFNFSISFTPALTAAMSYGAAVTITNTNYITVNPATDLGLEDGASLGYFMVGGGSISTSSGIGAYGGRIIQGTEIITTASTNLILTPGVGNNVASTISGGLTITTSNGFNHAGYRSGSSTTLTLGQGINGYGVGSVGHAYAGTMGQADPRHGFGTAVAKYSGAVASDGAILLFY